MLPVGHPHGRPQETPPTPEGSRRLAASHSMVARTRFGAFQAQLTASPPRGPRRSSPRWALQRQHISLAGRRDPDQLDFARHRHLEAVAGCTHAEYDFATLGPTRLMAGGVALPSLLEAVGERLHAPEEGGWCRSGGCPACAKFGSGPLVRLRAEAPCTSGSCVTQCEARQCPRLGVEGAAAGAGPVVLGGGRGRQPSAAAAITPGSRARPKLVSKVASRRR